MNKVLKHIYPIIFVLSLILNWANYGFIENTFDHNHSGFCNSNNFEHSPLDFCEDDLFVCHYKTKSNIFINMSDLVPLINVNYKNLYSSDIWQPPKFS
jgi:hypothetical protein